MHCLFLLLLGLAINYVYYRCPKKINNILPIALILALLHSLVEIMGQVLFTGLPWLIISPAYLVLTNNYVIQWSSIRGVLPISLLLLLINALLACFLVTKAKKLVITATALVAIIYLFGLVRLTQNESKKAASSTVYLINEHFDPYRNGIKNQLII